MQLTSTNGITNHHNPQNLVKHRGNRLCLMDSERTKVIDREIEFLRNEILKKKAAEQSSKEKPYRVCRLGSFFKVLLSASSVTSVDRLVKDVVNSSPDSTPVVYPSSLKKHAWIAAGSLTGLVVGGVINVIKTGSIFGNDKRACVNNQFGGFHIFGKINSFRENQLSESRAKLVDMVIPLNLINPLLPFIYLAPMFTYAIWNTVTQKKDAEKWMKKIFIQGCEHLYKDVVIPGMYATFLSVGGMVAREYIFDPLNQQKLDVSGHVILQIAQNLCAMKALQALKETGTSLQKKTFIMLNIAVAVTDGIWMYNTAAHCHSVADVIAGLACSAVAYAGIESGKIILSKVYN